jgi:hypothetical protein
MNIRFEEKNCYNQQYDLDEEDRACKPKITIEKFADLKLLHFRDNKNSPY